MQQQSRRQLLKNMLQGSLGLAALSSLQLTAMQKALAAQSAPITDYKALVCVFLFGGNDSANMLVPLAGDSLADYVTARQSLAVSGALPISPRTAVNDGIGLHPALASLQLLFNTGELAIVSGVGALQQPTTKIQVQQGNAVLPKNLYSHNDQQATWMRGQEPQSFDRGWGAQMLELLESSPDFSSCISLSGTNLWQRGQLLQPFGMSANGVPSLSAHSGNSSRALLLKNLQASLLAQQTHPLANLYAQSNSAAQARSVIVADALTQAPTLNTQFAAGNNLAQQLKMVARLMSVQSQLGVGRQVFFVGMGGFDTHDDQNTVHPALLGNLSAALASFQQATAELGLAQQVTTFTMSDFGRTLSSNGDGTDHGWAGNQLVLGGAVQGGDIYGQLVQQRLGSEFDVGGGRMIPTTANVQLFASLAHWFGLSESQRRQLFPALAAFDPALMPLFKPT
ncbi:MAG: DUF1501 domain-containing protein [Gammaproteobacteria bacterium]|nr:DUF1501 domain-containing protein [Gammaproteobacteria bacterium]